MSAKENKVKFMKISETLDEVEKDLKEEEDMLLKVKELVLKETRVLKAEEITIRRLIEAHSNPPGGKSSPDHARSSVISPAPTPGPTSLPEINLDISSLRSRKEEGSNDTEEFDSEEGEPVEEMVDNSEQMDCA